jgi:hypothetical protein
MVINKMLINIFSRVCIVFLLLPALVHAEMVLKAFPLAKIVEQQQEEVPEYRFVTGQVSSIGAQVRTDQAFIVAGKLTKVTYEIPRVHKTLEIMQYYQTQFQNLRAKTLFYCEGLNCGSSNDWANEIFRERILYGPDRFQFYIATTFALEGRQFAVAVYTTRRGNQRVYAHVEQIELVEKLAIDRQVASILLVSEKELSTLGLLKNRLEDWLAKEREVDDAAVTVAIVSYCRRPNKSSVENLKHAEDLGATLKTYLVREMLPEKSVQVIAVGPFAPPDRFSKHESFMELFVE